MPNATDAVAEELVSEEQLRAIVARLAEEIADEYRDKNPLIVGILVGSFVFVADLVRALDFPLEVAFVCAASYGQSTVAGELALKLDLDTEVAGRHLIVVDDILDTGRTLSKLTEMFVERGAASVRTCCVLDKPSRREVSFDADFVGMEIPDQFVVGYGLDYAQSYRNLPFVGVLRSEFYDDAAHLEK